MQAGGGGVPFEQQYAVVPPLPAVGVLQVSDASPWGGVAAPVHEYPTVFAAHPVTVASFVHASGVTVDAWLQQYAMRPPLPAVPCPHVRLESPSGGVTPPEHE
jgi:hypothetical protein